MKEYGFILSVTEEFIIIRRPGGMKSNLWVYYLGEVIQGLVQVEAWRQRGRAGT